MKRALFTLLGFLALAGCGRHDHDHDHEHDHASHGHAHTAPHGGALVMLGDHRYQLEIVPAPDGDALLLYVLDGHAEHFIRIEQTALTMDVNKDGNRHSLRFEAVADAATGETVGDTSHFRALAPFPLEEARFFARLREIQIRGSRFSDEAFTYPEGRH